MLIRFFKQKQNLAIVGLLMLLFLSVNATHINGSDFFGHGVYHGYVESESESGIKSVGGDIFSSFYYGLGKWLNGGGLDGNYPNYQNGMFHQIAEAIKTPFEIGLTLAIILVALSLYLDIYTKHIRKLIKFAFASVILVSFLDWNTFAYWIFDPLLSVLVGFMMLLLPSSGVGLSEAIFGVDEHFINLFNAIENYDKRIEANESWWETHVLEAIVMYLMLGLFAVLYAIFTILIIIGFFGFMMMTAFAPAFMAIGVFHKAMLLSWIKIMFNFFLIPIMTAAVMSVTIGFISEATAVITNLSPDASTFTKEIGIVFLVGIFSIGLHWKAPELAAGISGGMVSGAGSIVGTAAAVGGGAWALSKSPLGAARNTTNVVSGFRGGSFGNQNTGGYRGGQGAQALWDKMRGGGNTIKAKEGK